HTSPRFTWTMPSPQRGAFMHGTPGAWQTQPCSSWQLALQPSLTVVLPSSQFSPGSTRLLPQIEDRTQAWPGMQVNAGSWIVQVALQPSPSVVFLSSQTSPAPMIPSPHAILRMHAPADGHVQLGSTWQMPLQPSPATVLPSSHCSIPPWLLMPSPQPGGTGSVPPDPVAPVPVEPLKPPMPRLFEPPMEPPMPGPVPPVPVIGCVGWTPAVQPATTAKATDATPKARRVVGRKTNRNISAPYRPGDTKRRPKTHKRYLPPAA